MGRGTCIYSVGRVRHSRKRGEEETEKQRRIPLTSSLPTVSAARIQLMPRKTGEWEGGIDKPAVRETIFREGRRWARVTGFFFNPFWLRKSQEDIELVLTALPISHSQTRSLPLFKKGTLPSHLFASTHAIIQ